MNTQVINQAIKEIVNITIREGNKSASIVVEICRQEVGNKIAQAMFEKKYGSLICSIAEVGKAMTEKRAEETNQAAAGIYQIAMAFIKRMSAEQISAIANS